MLPIAGPNPPSTSEELVQAISDALAAAGVQPRKVQASGGSFPQIDQLAVDLTGTEFTREIRLKPTGGTPGDTHSVGKVTIQAAPLKFEGLPVQLNVEALGVALAVLRAKSGTLSLKPMSAESGWLTVQTERADLENVIQKFASEAAAKQGAQVKSTRLTLTNRGPRAVDFRADVTAKVFVMSAVLSLTGSVDVDDDLQLRFSNLAATGDGMVANLAAGFLKPRFAELQKAPIPLGALSFGDVQLRGLTLTGGDSIRLEAQFGSAAT